VVGNVTEYVSVRQAADILGVSHNTLRRMIRDNEISIIGVMGSRRAIVLDRLYIEREAARRGRPLDAKTAQSERVA
jgi:excisionase family DNA binding protein